MASVKYSGADLHLRWIHDGGTTDFADTYLNVTWNEEQQASDSTAGADEYMNSVKTLKDVSVDIELIEKKYGSGGSALQAAFRPGTSGTIIVSPEGTASGNPRLGGEFFVGTAPRTFAFNEAVKRTINLVHEGTALIYDGATAQWS